jgi:hypothetical protein
MSMTSACWETYLSMLAGLLGFGVGGEYPLSATVRADDSLAAVVYCEFCCVTVASFWECV